MQLKAKAAVASGMAKKLLRGRQALAEQPRAA